MAFVGVTWTGAWVELLEDMDGDGRAEVLVGGYIMAVGSGGSYIVKSSSLGTGGEFALTLKANCSVRDELSKGDDFGKPFVPLAAGDLDGGGTTDLAFGYPRDRVDGGSWVTVFFGEHFHCRGLVSVDGEADIRFYTLDETEAGSQLASGDVNGDGQPDLLVGASEWPEPHSGNGAVFLFDGASLQRLAVREMDPRPPPGSWERPSTGPWAKAGSPPGTSMATAWPTSRPTATSR